MDDISYKEIDLFVQEELSQHGEWLVDRFIEALEKGGHKVSGDLIDSFDYKTGTDGGTQTLTVSFLTYGRMTEAMARKRKQKAAWEKKNGEAWGKRTRLPKKVQWYNKNRYGGYGRLIRRLTAGMSDAELARIRGILTRAKADFTTNP